MKTLTKASALNTLLDQGLDFDTAVDLIKEASDEPEGFLATLNKQRHREGLKPVTGTGAAKRYSAAAAAGIIGSGLAGYGGWQGKYGLAAAGAGLALGTPLLINHLDKLPPEEREHEKASALNTLLDQGLDFDTAVDLIKEASDGINIKPSHKGELHEELGVPAGQKIPASKLQAAAHSSDPAERKRAVFAINAKRWNHKKAAVQELLESGVDVESAIAFAEESF